MKKIKLFLVALLFLLNSVTANAATQWCYFNVDYIWTSANGSLFFYPKERGDHIQVCNIDQPYQGISTTVCKSWFQTLTVATAIKKRVIIQYNDAPACTSLPTYSSAPVPNYIMLENP